MRQFLAIAFALALGACTTVNPFQSVTNPVSKTTLYQAELVFDATLKSFNTLKKLCIQKALPATCRGYVIKGQDIIRQAYAADKSARVFVKTYPTLDATNVIQAFTGLVSDFKGTVDALSVGK